MQTGNAQEQNFGFNPRARDGREDISKTRLMVALVSIHAPVMDAKQSIILVYSTGTVSIHAPVMDAKL